MVKKQVEIRLKTGLQARAAALFVQEATKFHSEVFLEKDEKKVNAKSIMGLMSLALSPGTIIDIIVDGRDEKEALEALQNFVESEG